MPLGTSDWNASDEAVVWHCLAWMQGWGQEGSRAWHRGAATGGPEVTRGQVLGLTVLKEPWLVVTLWTKSGPKGILLTILNLNARNSSLCPTGHLQLAVGGGNFLSSCCCPVLTLIWNRRLETWEKQNFSWLPCGLACPYLCLAFQNPTPMFTRRPTRTLGSSLPSHYTIHPSPTTFHSYLIDNFSFF